MSSETIRRRLVVHGKVQGVFYRDSVREAARNEGVAGWAANRSDGTVEVVLEGPPDAVRSVIGFSMRSIVSIYLAKHVSIGKERYILMRAIKLTVGDR